MDREELINQITERNHYKYTLEFFASPDRIAHDADIILARMAKMDQKPGPRVGDFVRLPGNKLARLGYHWGDSIQPTSTSPNCGGEGSFYLGEGYADHSGSYDDAIKIERFKLTDETMLGLIWISHNDISGGGRSIRAMVPFRVFEVVE